jgi:hypothetical protein
MKKGDLVRYYRRNHVSSNPPVTVYANTEASKFELVVILQYESWEKIATVLLTNGNTARVPANFLEIHKTNKDSI